MGIATLAGLLLIAVPVAFNASFALLAARFDYPDILRRPTGEVLERFRAGGTALVLIWWAFALTAVLFAPLVVLLSSAIGDADPTLLAVADDDRRARRGRPVPRPDPLAVPGSLPRPGRRRPEREPGPRARRSTSSSSPSTATSASPSASTSATLLTGAWSLLAGRRPDPDRGRPGWLGVVGIVIGPLLLLCSLEFVGRFEPHRLEARREAHADRLHRLVALADRHRHRAARLSSGPAAPGAG